MEEEKTLYVGIDIENDYTQASCLGQGMSQPESITSSMQKSVYRIPTCIYNKKSSNEWIIGEDAYRYREFNDGFYAENILERIDKNQEITINSVVVDPVIILERFLKKLMYVIKKKYPKELVKKLVITSRHNSDKVKDALLLALSKMGLHSDRVVFLDNLECFIYYTISQPKEIWSSDVAMFDYNTEGMFYYRLSFGRKKVPVVISSEKLEFSDIISYEMFDKANYGRLAYSFENISSPLLHKQLISTVFVTGSGFVESWADDTLKSWCLTRRVFKGQNLYCKGACFGAKLLDTANNEYMILNANMIKASVSLKVYKDAKNDEIILANAGDNWQNVDESVEIILDNTNEIAFVINNMMKKDSICAIMSLEGVPKRRDKSVRLNVHLRFYDKNTVIVKVKDVGFGDLYPSTLKVWEYIFKV